LSLDITWSQILLRLLLAFTAGTLIGFNRSAHGHEAGLRTTILVTLTACVAMIQVNLLLGLTGKAPNSFIQLDLMRLPLGILTGVGFIGGGAILHKKDIVVGVTTAATLWFSTVIGLCFGAVRSSSVWPRSVLWQSSCGPSASWSTFCRRTTTGC